MKVLSMHPGLEESFIRFFEVFKLTVRRTFLRSLDFLRQISRQSLQSLNFKVMGTLSFLQKVHDRTASLEPILVAFEVEIVHVQDMDRPDLSRFNQRFLI